MDVIVYFKRYVNPEDSESYMVKGNYENFQTIEYTEPDSTTKVKVMYKNGVLYIHRKALDLHTKVFLSTKSSHIHVTSEHGEMEIQAILHHMSINQDVWDVEYSLPEHSNDRIHISWSTHLMN